MKVLKILKQKTIYVVLAAALLSSCAPTKHNKLTIIHLVDVSDSAIKDDKFIKLSQDICDLLTQSLVVDDLYLRINIDSALPPFKDPIKIEDNEQIKSGRKNCKNNKPNSDKDGTFACPAWMRTIDILSRAKSPLNKPLIISQIQSNEWEFETKNIELECVNTVRSLAEIISEKKGKFVHLDSRDEGSRLNSWLKEHLLNYTNVDYYDESHFSNIQSDIRTLRFEALEEVDKQKK